MIRKGKKYLIWPFHLCNSKDVMLSGTVGDYPHVVATPTKISWRNITFNQGGIQHYSCSLKDFKRAMERVKNYPPYYFPKTSLTTKEQWEETIDNFVRDATKVLAAMPKSEFRARLNKILDQQKREMVEWAEKEKVEEGEAMYSDDPDGKMSEGYTDGYNQALDDIITKIKGNE